MAAGNSSFLQVGVDLLNTVKDAATGTILAQLGSVVSGLGDSDRAEWWQHVGFASRPSNPAAGKASAQGVKYTRGDRDVIIASRDLRGQALAGALAPGETCLYAAGADGNAQGRVMVKADGTVALYTAQGNAAGGASTAVTVGPDGSISLGTPYGGIQINQNGITIMHSSGVGILMNAQGISMIGQSLVLNGSNVLLGALASPATPAVYGPIGLSAIGSTSVFVSP